MYGGDCDVMHHSSTPAASMMMMLTGGGGPGSVMALPGGGPAGMMAQVGLEHNGGVNQLPSSAAMRAAGMGGGMVLPGIGMGMTPTATSMGMGGGFPTADLLFTSSPPPGTGMHIGLNPQFGGGGGGFLMSSPFHPALLSGNGSLALQPMMIPKEESSLRHSRTEEELDSGGGSGASASAQLDGLSCGEEQDNTDPSLYNNNSQQQHLMMNQDADQQIQQQQQDGQAAPGQKKKRYHRHTARQIQVMEALFKECPHPDDKQRMRLSQELGLRPRQVKFWFQNRRTQMKAQQDRTDNVSLRSENDSLKNENFRLQAAIRNVVCPNCGGPAIIGEMSLDEQHLRLENARLKEELDRLHGIVPRYGAGQPPHPAASSISPLLLPPPSLDLDMGMYTRHFLDQQPPMQHNHHHRRNSIGSIDMSSIPMHHLPPQQPSCQFTAVTHQPLQHQQQQQQMPLDFILVPDHDKQRVLDLAAVAAQEMLGLCRTDDPLWRKKNYTAAGDSGEVMAFEEHRTSFHSMARPATGMRRMEGTRDRGHVMMNCINLVDAFFDEYKYTHLFPSIIANAKTIQVISPATSSSGPGNGSLHLMYAELLMPSPLVPTREAYFFRYCKHNTEEGYWMIVDFPADAYTAGTDGTGIQIPDTGYNRKPSGCVFQDMPNGYSVVTWVEQAEVEDKGPLHPVFRDLVTRGEAFGATRWLAVLQQQCDRLASAMARNVTDLRVITSPEGRQNMMRLSQRMVRAFCSNVSLQLPGPLQQHQKWTSLSDSTEDAVRITVRKNTDAGQPTGAILVAVSTIWLPHSHGQVFELLADETKRVQLDVLSNGNPLHEVAHIANGSNTRNCVCLYRINSSSNSSQNVELMLQESHTHATGGSMVVYANMDVDAVQAMASGNDTSYIPLLPTGFVVVPAAATSSQPSNNMPTTIDGNLIAGADGSSELQQSSYPSSHCNTAEAAAGCLLTVGIQVLASAVPSANPNLSSVTALNNHLCNAIKQITAALGSGPTGIVGLINPSSSPQNVIQAASVTGTSASTADS